MKKFIVATVAVAILLSSLVGCAELEKWLAFVDTEYVDSLSEKNESYAPESDTVSSDTSFEELQTNKHICGDDGKCTECGEIIYDFKYISNNDGTCYVSDIIINHVCEDTFALNIPEESPDGDIVTAVKCEDFAYPIPQILSAQDMSGIYGKLSETNYTVSDAMAANKIKSLYTLKTVSNLYSEGEILDLLAEYPICEFVDVYVLNEQTTMKDAIDACLVLEDRVGYTCTDKLTYLDNLYSVVSESNASNKEAILQSLPYDRMPIAHNVGAINIPNTVIEIPMSLYVSCPDLTELIIPKCITQIDFTDFSSNAKIEKIVVHENVTKMHSISTLKPEIDSIVIADENQKYLGLGNCIIDRESKILLKGFNNSTIPNTPQVTMIGDEAFKNTDIYSIKISNNITSIGASAFYGTKITDLIIPGSVKTISDLAFAECMDLEILILEEGIDTIGNFDTSFFGGGAFKNCRSLISVSIPDSVTILGSFTFGGCSSLESVSLGSGLKKIGMYVFNGSGITNIIIPQNVNIIANNAFSGCSVLTSISFTNTSKRWYYTSTETSTSGTSISVTNDFKNATNLVDGGIWNNYFIKTN